MFDWFFFKYVYVRCSVCERIRDSSFCSLFMLQKSKHLYMNLVSILIDKQEKKNLFSLCNTLLIELIGSPSLVTGKRFLSVLKCYQISRSFHSHRKNILLFNMGSEGRRSFWSFASFPHSPHHLNYRSRPFSDLFKYFVFVRELNE